MTFRPSSKRVVHTLDPTPFAYGAGPLGPFARSASLTRDGSILDVETPGHMVGQVNVVVRGEDVTYILAGDLTYRERNLIEDKVDCVTMSVQTSLASQRAIKAFARSEPSVLLPAHDPTPPRALPNVGACSIPRSTRSTAPTTW